MNDSINSIFSSMLLRTLQFDPSLSVKKGIERVGQLLPSNVEFLQETGKQIRRRGILNPNWLAKTKRMKIHFYLVNSQAGWFRAFVDQTKALAGLSHYVLYGVWDSLIVLHGTEKEASQLRNNIEDSKSDLSYFSASRISLFHGCRIPPSKANGKSQNIDSDTINALVDDYDNPKLRAQRTELEESGIFIGSTLELDPAPTTDVSAFVGIKLGRGSHAVDSSDVLNALTQDETLRTCMVHLVETEPGFPYNYLAKLVCGGRDELDRATDAIADCRVGRVFLEGNTSIVARGKQEFTKVSSERAIEIGPSPDLRQVENDATTLLIDLGPDFTNGFNLLPTNTQLVVLRSLIEINQQIQDRFWDDDSQKLVESTYLAFARASIIEGAAQGSIGNSIMRLAPHVETILKKALGGAIETAYDKDFARAPDAFKLSTRDINRVSLGKVVAAFREMKSHEDFKFIWAVLNDVWLKKLEAFTQARNIVAHSAGATGASQADTIDAGRRTLIDGIDLLRWLSKEVLTVLKERVESSLEGQVSAQASKQKNIYTDTIRLKPQGREFGIFLSHSSMDSEKAKSLAEALRALDYPVWYSDWAIEAGESIVKRINEALDKNDTLIVLLSKSSVQSRWVERELNTALMSQLRGEEVRVLPVLIEDCKIPPTLQDIKYIDMKHSFQEGFIELLRTLQKRNRK